MAVQEDTQFSWAMLRLESSVDQVFQAKFPDRTDQVYLFELGFKKVSQSVFKSSVLTPNENHLESEILGFITKDSSFLISLTQPLKFCTSIFLGIAMSC